MAPILLGVAKKLAALNQQTKKTEQGCLKTIPKVLCVLQWKNHCKAATVKSVQSVFLDLQ